MLRTEPRSALVVFRAMLLVSILGFALSSGAYDQAGHFYTVRAALTKSDSLSDFPFNPQQGALIAFCAQLPDLASDLDAIGTEFTNRDTSSYSSALKYLFSLKRFDPARDDYGDDEGLRRTLAVHVLLHSLTGSTSKAAHDAALQVVNELWTSAAQTRSFDDLCALGLGLHFLGDSQAHRRLFSPDKMYQPLVGHAMAGHSPDFFWFELCHGFFDRLRYSCRTGTTSAVFQRYGFWLQYVADVSSGVSGHLASTLTAHLGRSARNLEPFLRSSERNQTGNDWFERMDITYFATERKYIAELGSMASVVRRLCADYEPKTDCIGFAPNGTNGQYGYGLRHTAEILHSLRQASISSSLGIDSSDIPKCALFVGKYFSVASKLLASNQLWPADFRIPRLLANEQNGYDALCLEALHEEPASDELLAIKARIVNQNPIEVANVTISIPRLAHMTNVIPECSLANNTVCPDSAKEILSDRGLQIRSMPAQSSLEFVIHAKTDDDAHPFPEQTWIAARIGNETPLQSEPLALAPVPRTKQKSQPAKEGGAKPSDKQDQRGNEQVFEFRVPFGPAKSDLASEGLARLRSELGGIPKKQDKLAGQTISIEIIGRADERPMPILGNCRLSKNRVASIEMQVRDLLGNIKLHGVGIGAPKQHHCKGNQECLDRDRDAIVIMTRGTSARSAPDNSCEELD